MRRNPPRTTADHPTYCQVVHRVTLQQRNPTFSSTASSAGGSGSSPPAGSGAAHADTELTKNVIYAPESDTPTDLEGGNLILNLTLTTGLEDQELPDDINSDVTSEGSFGANNDDSTYLGLRAKIRPYFKIPLRIFRPSSRNPETSSRYLTKGTPI